MNHFLCLILLLTVVYQVGGLQPQPLIYRVAGKMKTERRVALLPLQGLRCKARGKFVGGAWRFGGQPCQPQKARGMEVTQTRFRHFWV